MNRLSARFVPMLAILLTLTATAALAETPPSPAEADWSGFEKGVDLLAQGKARRAARAFDDVEAPQVGDLAHIAADLARAYARDESKKPYEALPHLQDAIRKTRASQLPEAVFRRALEISRDRLRQADGQAPQVRALLCHLEYLGQQRPSVDEAPAQQAFDLDPRPRRLFSPSAIYTPEARKARVKGTVFTKLVIDADGCANRV